MQGLIGEALPEGDPLPLVAVMCSWLACEAKAMAGTEVVPVLFRGSGVTAQAEQLSTLRGIQLVAVVWSARAVAAAGQLLLDSGRRRGAACSTSSSRTGNNSSRCNSSSSSSSGNSSSRTGNNSRGSSSISSFTESFLPAALLGQIARAGLELSSCMQEWHLAAGKAALTAAAEHFCPGADELHSTTGNSLCSVAPPSAAEPRASSTRPSCSSCSVAAAVKTTKATNPKRLASFLSRAYQQQ